MKEKKPTTKAQIEKNQSAAPDSKKSKGTGRGGARKGAGRKPGAVSVKTREIAERLISDGGLTPLEVMLKTMRAFMSAAEQPGFAGEDSLKLMTAASRVASDAAPYMHPRLAAIEHSGPDGAPISVDWTNLSADAAEAAYKRMVHGQ